MAARQAELEKTYKMFDYNKAKAKYWETINNTPAIYREATELANIKKELKPSNVVCENANRYELFTANGKEILIINRNRCENIIEVVSPEDCFDLFADIHLATGHGGKETMIQFMRQKYQVSVVCLSIFLKLCDLCKNRTISDINDKSKNSVTVSLVDLKLQKDGDFGYILIYKSNNTGFILLRPITTINVHNEVTMELLNIFLDFGAPHKIIFNSKLMTMFQSVLAQIRLITHDLNIPYIEETDTTNMDLFIIKKISDWVSSSSSPNWYLACHLIQWKINTSAPVDPDVSIKYDSPYDATFNKTPRCKDAATSPKISERRTGKQAAVINDGEKEIADEETVIDFEIKEEFEETVEEVTLPTLIKCETITEMDTDTDENC